MATDSTPSEEAVSTDVTHDRSTRYAVSADGTRIAYETHGSGPALVFVDGALCHRRMGPSRPLARQLASHFTVHVYDRRGRGESEPGHATYHPDREVEDLAAVIAAAGGHAHVFGASSGGRSPCARPRRGCRSIAWPSTRRRSSSTTPTRRTTPGSASARRRWSTPAAGAMPSPCS